MPQKVSWLLTPIFSLNIVAGAAGGGLTIDVILILGFSSVIADAISMGVGDALSTKSENEWILAEKKREEWEFDNFPEGEEQEMVDLYEQKGLPREEAVKVIAIMSKHRDFFVNVMMAEELELIVPDPDDNPWIAGGVTFCSFVFFGTIPLLSYAVFYNAQLYIHEQFIIACILTGLCLFGLGVTKSKFTKQPWNHAGMEVFLLGGTVAALAYFVGWFISSVVLRGKAGVGSIH